MPRPPEQLDSRTQVATPENIAFEYRAAGPFSRIGAYVIDVVIQILAVVISMVLFILLIAAAFSSTGGGSAGWDILGNFGGFTIFVLWFLMQWFYGAYFELKWNGQTPGKRALGLRVLQTDGRPIDLQQAVLRNVLRLIDAMPFLPLGDTFDTVLQHWIPLARGSHLVALTSMALTDRHQRVGDLVCGTMVVAEDRSLVGKVEAINDPAITTVQEQVPAGYVPSRTLSRALAHYVGRRRYFGPARRQEIARHVGAVLIDRLNLPANTDCDLLLCALYNRAFRSESIEAAVLENETLSVSPSDDPPTKTNDQPTDWESVPLG